MAAPRSDAIGTSFATRDSVRRDAVEAGHLGACAVFQSMETSAMTKPLPESALEELKALSRDELWDLQGFNRLLRSATGFRSALEPAIESLLGEREALRREPQRRLSARPVSHLTPIPQS
jgi:hypothetical protein